VVRAWPRPRARRTHAIAADQQLGRASVAQPIAAHRRERLFGATHPAAYQFVAAKRDDKLVATPKQAKFAAARHRGGADQFADLHFASPVMSSFLCPFAPPYPLLAFCQRGARDGWRMNNILVGDSI
jgi:hypothetical protein